MMTDAAIAAIAAGKSLNGSEEARDKVEEETVDRDYETGNGYHSKENAAGLVGIAEFLYSEIHQGHAQHYFDQSKHNQVSRMPV